ncbi:MAG: DUF6716 putative glycosyltransferase [Hyphomicrobiales bacterium]
MKLAFYTYPKGWPWPNSWRRLKRSWHQYESGKVLQQGMRLSGTGDIVIGKYNKPCNAKVAIIWSWKQLQVIAAQQTQGNHLLVLERGFIQPRNDWVSLSWDGFNGRGYFPKAPDSGQRFEKYFSHHLKPWRKPSGNRALLIGQVPGDASLEGADMYCWLQDTVQKLKAMGASIIFRPHPNAQTATPEGTVLASGSLQQAFDNCDFVVTFSSTTAVEAVLAGIPTVIFSDGSVAAPMGSRFLDEPLKYPDRTQWCHDLAWRQWTLHELADGTAWRHAVQYLASS